MPVFLAAVVVALSMTPASAHGFTSVVYIDATSPEKGHLRTQLGLEYDLLVVSAADATQDDALFRDGTAAFESQDPAQQVSALTTHRDSVVRYVTQRFTVGAGETACPAEPVGDIAITEREGVPYVLLVLDHTCASSESSGYELSGRLFADSEGYVRDVKTIVTYDVDGRSGSAAWTPNTTPSPSARAGRSASGSSSGSAPSTCCSVSIMFCSCWR